MAKKKVLRGRKPKQRPRPAKQKPKARKKSRAKNIETGTLALRIPLPHGRAISAEEFEIEVGRAFSVESFVSLCNAIAWSIGSWVKGLAQLSFTERVNVADNGIDAEWTLECPLSTRPTQIVVPGWNVFQYKKRDVTAQGRQRTLTALVSNIKGALRDLEQRASKKPDRYVLCTNVHLTRADKVRLEKSIRWKYKGNCHVLVLGASELSAFTNDLPHLRSGYFSTSEFGAWALAWNAHRRQKLLGTNIELIGRDQILKELTSAIDDPSVQVLLISGAHQIGKSRLVFEATKHRQLEAVVGLDPLSITTTDLLGLQGNVSGVLVIIEDVEADTATQLANVALGQTKLKLILTVPTSDPALAVNFGLDKRVKHIPIDGISDQDASSLLRIAGAKFDYSVESWVIQQTGGNPGILLAAAQIADLRSKAESFTDQIARSFENKIKAICGEKGLTALRVVSLLTHLGFRDAKADDLAIVSEFLGSRQDEVWDSIKGLTAAGVVRIQGSFLETIPVLLANYEAFAAIRGKSGALPQLLKQLDHDGQRRLIRRLRVLQGPEINKFWDEFFGKDKEFGNFDAALDHGDLLRMISSGVPDRVGQLINAGLSKLPYEGRTKLTGDQRRDLMWTLEELLFRKRTSESALRSISLLAEAENEGIRNNATGVFKECFNPLHPQFPLSLERRLTVLREGLAPDKSEQMNILAVKGIAEAFNFHGTVALRRSDGAVPLDSRPEMKWGEMWEYWKDLATLAWETCRSKRQTVSEQACSALPRILYGLVAQTPPLDAARFCKTVVDEVLTEKLHISLNELCADLILGQQVADSYLQDHPRYAEAKEASKILSGIVVTIEGSSFDVRLKRWVGGWQSGKHETTANGNVLFESDKKIEALSRECAENRELLTDELLDWLLSSDGKQSWTFFHHLGRFDLVGTFKKQLEVAAQSSNGAVAFGAYVGGLAAHSPDIVEDHLDQLAQEKKVCGLALLYASAHRPGYRRSVDRIRNLILENRIEGATTARALSGGGWSKNLTNDECYDLLSAIAGPTLSEAAAVIDVLAMWAGYYGKPLEGKLADLAWHSLEATPAKVPVYDADLLAATLVNNDPDRAFRLLEMLMNQPHHIDGWQPIDHHNTRKFWDALHKFDKSRLLRVVFDLDFEGITKASSISWNLPELIEWDKDSEELKALAQEDESKAMLVLDCVPRPGLWPLALELLQRFPDSKRIRQIVASRARHDREVIVGSMSSHYESCASDIKRIMDDPKTPLSVHSFLREMLNGFQEAARREKRTEEDEAINW